MPDRIDWNFISREEGGQHLSAYVPKDSSGATIATGYDLGSKNEFDLRRHGIPNSLTNKLRPYLGLKGAAARARLRSVQLVVTQAEADAIDGAYRGFLFRSLYNLFPNEAGFSFGSLPVEVQTVIASVATQHGEHLNQATPNFWSAMKARDWGAALAELRNFGDDFPSRRNREADVLERLVP